MCIRDSDRVAEEVIGTPEPRSVPAVFRDGGCHRRRGGEQPGALVALTPPVNDGGQLSGGEHKLTGDEDGLGNPSAPVLGGLERLSGCVGEAVEVETCLLYTSQNLPVPSGLDADMS